MASNKYHMRIAVNSLDAPLCVLGNDVCIDVVLRGNDKNDIDLVAIALRSYLDSHTSGHWAGIGRGEYVETEVKLA